MIRCRGAVLAAVTALLLPCAAARARITAYRTELASGSPALGPGDVLWTDAANDETPVFRMGLPAGGSATLFAPRTATTSIGLAQSGTRVVFGLAREDFDDVQSFGPPPPVLFGVVRSGAPGFPLVAGDLDGKLVVEDFDLDGDTLVTDEFAGQVHRVMVHDLGGLRPTRQLGPDGALSGRVAGAFAAYAVPGDFSTDVVVVDLASGQEQYRVTVPGRRPGVDLAADGTLALVGPLALGHPASARVAWASMAAPSLHVLARDASFPHHGLDAFGDARRARVRVAGGRIAYLRGDSTQVALADIATGALAAASFPSRTLTGFDFDGSRVAYATRSCVLVDDLAGPAPTTPPPGVCPLVDVDPDLYEHGKGLALTVHCRSDAGARCRGGFVIRSIDARRGRHVVFARGRFDVPAGHQRTSRVPFSRAQRRRLASLSALLSANHDELLAVLSAIDPGGVAVRAVSEGDVASAP